jgi:hypothetical protein
LSVGLLVTLSSLADAQVRGSERGRISQTSDGTTVTVDYARPLVRGRSPVFPDLVDWGHVWTPGANASTTLEFDKDVTLNGMEVPAGRYSVWMVPAQEEWEFILDPDDRRYHTQPPEPRDDQIRMPISPGTTEFTEVLTWEFAEVDPEGMGLRFRWDDTRVDLRIDIEPTFVAEVDPDEAALIEGRYGMTMAGPPPPGVPADAVPPQMAVDIRYDEERLVGRMDGPDGLPTEFALIPVAELVYNPGWMMNGEIFEVEVEMFFEFTAEGGAIQGFDVRGVVEDQIDRLMMSAQRIR